MYYKRALEVFDHIKDNLTQADPVFYRVLANSGYSLIGLARYQDALKEFDKASELAESDNLNAWHYVAIAYCHYKLGDKTKYEEFLTLAKSLEEYEYDKSNLIRLYPEIAKDI